MKFPGPGGSVNEILVIFAFKVPTCFCPLFQSIVGVAPKFVLSNSLKNVARQTGNVLHFEKLSRLKLKISDQKFKILSAKINLINTPTAYTIIDLEKNNE